MMKDLCNNSKHVPSWMMAVVLFVFGCVFISAGIVETSTFAQGKWKNTKYGFGVPAYFSNGSEYFYGDGPYSMQIYKHQNAEISYCGLLGNWAIDDSEFPGRGSVISRTATIRNITYRSRNGIFSGYTTDGRIYYMKKKVDSYNPNAAVRHAYFLAVIYPKSRQAEMEKVTKMISKW